MKIIFKEDFDLIISKLDEIKKDEKKFNSKKKKFEKLKSYQRKLLFWTNELGISYIDFTRYKTFWEHETLRTFIIKVEKSDWLEFNKWILGQFKMDYSDSFSIKLQSLDNLKTIFKKANKEAVKSPHKYLNEIYSIENSFSYPMYTEYVYTPQQKYSSKYFAYNESYINYIDFGIAPDYSNIEPGTNTIYYENGKILAEYRMYLEEELEKYSDRSLVSNDEVTLGIQFLIVYYLDLLGPLSITNQRKAVLLSKIFRTPGAENIRKGFSDLTVFKSPKNLNYVADLFQSLGLDKAYLKVKKDIDNQSSRK